MHRDATLAELNALLDGNDIPCPELLQEEEPGHQRFKEQAMRAFMEPIAAEVTRYILRKLRNQSLRVAVGEVVQLDWRDVPKDDPRYLAACADFVDSILELYERDFVTLRHGQQGALFDKPHPPAIRFLLTGVTLALLYDALDEKKSLVERLVHEALIVVSALDKWLVALRCFGPVPVSNVPLRRLTDQPIAELERMAINDPKRLSLPSSTTAPCGSCQQPLQQHEDDMLVACEHCGHSIIKYQLFVVHEQLRPPVSAEPEPTSRARTFSY
eukprot:m.33819 g.33819  ORF g.33819 m.33819 type:complete len:271 (+) comp9673_c0_seq4:814-1626(+)